MASIRTLTVVALGSALAGQKTDLAEIHRSANVLMAQPSFTEVQRAMVKLGCGGENAVPALKLLLNDPRLRIRAQVYRVLEEIGEPARGAVPELIRRTKSKDKWERIRVAQLALTFDPACEKAMGVLGLCSNMEYRTRAASKLGVARGKDTLDLLTNLIDDDYKRVRYRAFESVGQQGERAAPMTPALIAAMTGPKGAKIDIEDIPGAIFSGGDKLEGAARALFEVGSKTVSGLLAKHAKGGVRVQFRVLNVLGAMGEEDAQRKAIHISVLSRDEDLRRIAFECLMNLSEWDGSDLPALVESAVGFPGTETDERIDRYLISVKRPFAVVSKSYEKAAAAQRGVLVATVGRVPLGMDEVRLLRRTEILLVAARDEDAKMQDAAVAAAGAILARETGAGSIDALLPVLQAVKKAGADLRSIEKVLYAIAKSGDERKESRAAARRVLNILELGR